MSARLRSYSLKLNYELFESRKKSLKKFIVFRKINKFISYGTEKKIPWSIYDQIFILQFLNNFFSLLLYKIIVQSSNLPIDW